MFESAHIEEINALDTNFRSDVIAAGLVDGGFEADKIVVLRRDGSARETDKEVVSIRYKQDWEGNGSDVMLVLTNRMGIYDMLPEGMFHNPSSLKDASKEAVVHSFRQQSKEEFFIRRFFSPYEAEVESTRIDVQLTEYRYDRPDRHRAMVDTMSRLWPIIDRMDSLTATLFLRTVPYIADIRGNYTQTSQALAMITGYEVGIEEKISVETPKAKYTRLNVMKLGVNAVLKGQIPVRYAQVNITPPREALSDVLPGQSGYDVLAALLDTFMPNDIDYKICIKPHEEDYTSRLGDKTNPCILGVNARLKSKSYDI